MIVKMLRSIRIAKDGFNVETAFEGQEIDLPLPLAQGLIRDKLAEELKSVPEKENKKEEVKKEEAKKDISKKEDTK